MSRREIRPVTWAAGQSLSSWTWFGAEGPSAVVLPAGMSGTQLAVVATESGAGGDADPAQAADLLAAVDLGWRHGYDVSAWLDFMAHHYGRAFAITQPDSLGRTGWPLLVSAYNVVISSTSGGPEVTTALEMADLTNGVFGPPVAASQDALLQQLCHAALHMLAEMRPADAAITAALARMPSTHHPAAFDGTAFKGNPKFALVKPGATRAP